MKKLWITYQLELHQLNGRFLKGVFKSFAVQEGLRESFDSESYG